MSVTINITDDKFMAIVSLLPDKADPGINAEQISAQLNSLQFTHFKSLILLEKAALHFNQTGKKAVKFRVYSDDFLELEQYFQVKISADEMFAYINVNILPDAAEKVTYDFLKRLLMKNGISCGVLITDLQNLTNQLRKTTTIEKYLVATGQKEVMAVDGTLRLHELFTRSEKIVRVLTKNNTKKQITAYAVVTAGALPAGTRLLVKHMPVDGKAGLTITNRQIWSEGNKQQVADPAVALSKNVTARRFSDRIEYASTVRGVGYFIDNRIIEVDEVFDGEFFLAASDDKMELYLSLQSPKGGEPIKPEEVRKAIADKNIKGDVDYVLVEAEINKINLGKETRISRTVIARGIAPVDGLDGEIKWKTNLEQFYKPCILEDGSVDYRGGQCFPFVREGAAAGVWLLATKGIKAGTDIFGTPLLPEDGKGISVKFNDVFSFEDTEETEKGRAARVLIPKISGLLRMKKDIATIDPVFEINTVDYAVGNLDFDGTLIIKDTVIDGFTVHSTNDIHIKGNVGACTIVSEGNIFIQGGMNGRGTGKIKAGGNVHIKFTENCRVEAGESVYVINHAVLSYLSAGKSILVGINRVKGKIIGSQLFAWQSIETHCVGTNSSASDSTLHIGINKELYDFVEHLKEEIEALKIEISRLQNKAAKPDTVSADQLELVKNELEEKISKLNEDIGQCQEKESQIYNENPERVCILNDIQAHTRIFIGKINYELIIKKEKICFRLDKNKIIQEPLKSSK